MTRSEVKAMRVLVADAVIHHPDVDAPCMRPGADPPTRAELNSWLGAH